MKILRLEVPHSQHDALFVARYARLLAHALQLCDGHRAIAEDLVQDCFIRFVTIRPDLEGIEHLDAYLRTMLRHMHLSRVRRAARQPALPMSLVDFDSVSLGLRALDGRSALQVRDELRALCRYGCERCTTSKTGSVFLLRFFHGFAPSEIARLIGSAPRVVNQWVTLARREARLAIAQPGGFTPRAAAGAVDRAPRASSPPRVVPLPTAAGDALSGPHPAADAPDVELLRELMDSIFSHRHGECLTPGEWRELYATESQAAIETPWLAAIVTCPDCLDEACRRTGLPGRDAHDPWDAGRSSGSAPPRQHGPARPPRPSSPHVASRRVEETTEHQPVELSVVVNGFVCGTQRVGGECSEIALAVNLPEPIGLIELFSEQGVCLSQLAVDAPPAGRVTQSAMVTLTEGRRVTLAVSFADAWPLVRATYEDPQALRAPLPAPSETALHETAPHETAAHETAPRHRGGLVLAFDSASERGAWTAWIASAWRPRTLAGKLVLISALAWLFFATPFTDVSAAERVHRLARRALAYASETLGWRTGSAAPPPVPASPPRPSAASAPAPRTPIEEVVTPTRRSVPIRPGREALAQAELSVLGRLQHAGAYLGQEVALSRGPNGDVRFELLVRDAARKRDLLDTLRALARPPWLQVNVLTLGEAAARPRASSPRRASAESGTLRTYVADDRRMPAYDTVRAYILAARPSVAAATAAANAAAAGSAPANAAANGAAPDGAGLDGAVDAATDDARIDAEVQRFADRMLERSRVASQHAWALTHLAESYPDAVLATLGTDARELFASVAWTHARELERQTELLRRELEPVFLPAPDPDEAPAAAAGASRAAPRTEDAARRLATLSSLQERAIREAFTVAADGPAASLSIESEAFRQALRETARLARRVQGVAGPD